MIDRIKNAITKGRVSNLSDVIILLTLWHKNVDYEHLEVTWLNQSEGSEAKQYVETGRQEETGGGGRAYENKLLCERTTGIASQYMHKI